MSNTLDWIVCLTSIKDSIFLFERNLSNTRCPYANKYHQSRKDFLQEEKNEIIYDVGRWDGFFRWSKNENRKSISWTRKKTEGVINGVPTGVCVACQSENKP